MEYGTFEKFWTAYSNQWYNLTELPEGPVASLCKLKPNYVHDLYKRYELIKKIIKSSYFKNINSDPRTCHLSRYKRAAVLTYAIIKSDPLEYLNQPSNVLIDPLFLKQRLAFYVALGSIIQDFPEDKIKEKIGNYGGTIFEFSKLGKKEHVSGEDDFLMSVYKDLLYSEIYDNFNVLTMANVYGLLTERASILGDMTPAVD